MSFNAKFSAKFSKNISEFEIINLYKTNCKLTAFVVRNPDFIFSEIISHLEERDFPLLEISIRIYTDIYLNCKNHKEKMTTIFKILQQISKHHQIILRPYDNRNSLIFFKDTNYNEIDFNILSPDDDYSTLIEYISFGGKYIEIISYVDSSERLVFVFPGSSQNTDYYITLQSSDENYSDFYDSKYFSDDIKITNANVKTYRGFHLSFFSPDHISSNQSNKSNDINFDNVDFDLDDINYDDILNDGIDRTTPISFIITKINEYCKIKKNNCSVILFGHSKGAIFCKLLGALLNDYIMEHQIFDNQTSILLMIMTSGCPSLFRKSFVDHYDKMESILKIDFINEGDSIVELYPPILNYHNTRGYYLISADGKVIRYHDQETYSISNYHFFTKTFFSLINTVLIVLNMLTTDINAPHFAQDYLLKLCRYEELMYNDTIYNDTIYNDTTYNNCSDCLDNENKLNSSNDTTIYIDSSYTFENSIYVTSINYVNYVNYLNYDDNDNNDNNDNNDDGPNHQ